MDTVGKWKDDSKLKEDELKKRSKALTDDMKLRTKDM